MRTSAHLYDPATGVFTGEAFHTDAADKKIADRFVALNTPKGRAAYIGTADHRTQKVDIATGKLVPYQPPPAPGAARQAALQRIHQLEGTQNRAIRELLIAMKPAGAHDALKQLEAIDTQIAALRPQLKGDSHVR